MEKGAKVYREAGCSTNRGSSKKLSRQLKGELKGELDKQVNAKLRKEVLEWVSRRLEKNLENGLFKVQQGVQANRFLYGLLVGMGFFLFWYGAWKTISLIPIINKGFVALTLGLFFLVISGTFYYKIIGGPISKEK